MNFFPWPEISNFHNLRKYLKQYPESLDGYSKIRYLAKVKLDGTNAAVIISPKAEVFAQSRSKIIHPSDDNMGFAKWVESQEKYWKKLSFDDKDLIIFGEWAGIGIQKNVAISQISKKIFAVFCIVFRHADGKITLETDPDLIKEIVSFIPDVYVLPWFSQKDEKFNVTIDWNASAEKLQLELDRINAAVLEVEDCDPWVRDNFKVEGIGEGLVFYPIGTDAESWDKFSIWLFKAKGEKHKTVKQSAPAQANAEVVNSVKEYADLVLTEARLEQGASEVWKTLAVAGQMPENMYLADSRLIGKFLKWIEADLKKETKAELDVSSLTWDKVNKLVMSQAREWYLNKIKVS